MPVQTRSRAKNLKRNRESIDNDNDESKQEEHPKKKRKISSSEQLMDLSEYICCICREFPSNQIYQCCKGCLICSDCYPKILDDKCPLCRTFIDIDDPIRCRFAENSLKKRVVECHHDGCNRKMIYSKLKIHQKHECNKRPAICKFHILGCTWNGIEQDRQTHEANCNLDQNEILSVVQNYKQIIQKHKEKKAENNLLTNMMSHMFVQSDETHHFDVDDDEFGTTFIDLVTPRYKFEYLSSQFYFEFKSVIEIKDDKQHYLWSAKLCYVDEETPTPHYERDYHFGLLISAQNEDENETISTPMLISRMQERTVPANQSKGEWIAFDNSFPCDIHSRLFDDGLKIMIFG